MGEGNNTSAVASMPDEHPPPHPSPALSLSLSRRRSRTSNWNARIALDPHVPWPRSRTHRSPTYMVCSERGQEWKRGRQGGEGGESSPRQEARAEQQRGLGNYEWEVSNSPGRNTRVIRWSGPSCSRACCCCCCTSGRGAHAPLTPPPLLPSLPFFLLFLSLLGCPVRSWPR